jgi:para-aminobenzoate synthetase component 1
MLPPGVGAVAMRRGNSTVVASEPSEIVVGNGAEGIARLDRLAPGFWAGFLAFELGHAIERVDARGASLEAATVPDVVFARFDARAVIAPDGRVTIEGDGPGWSSLEGAVRAAAHEASRFEPVTVIDEGVRWHSSLARDEYEARVAEVLRLLAAGECYQVNVTRRLMCDRALDPVRLFGVLAARHPAPHAAFLRLELADEWLAVVSASPERFLRRRGDHVETRPIKGTAATAEQLRASPKDHAENVMIVDLARNDLGRVCVPGSIEVPALCAVEAHPGLHHLVSTVRGRLQPGVGLAALVRATFAPASVTGAPKPRVLQAIEDLEPVRRGVYCGALGWIDTEHLTADLAVAIRTFTISGTVTGTVASTVAGAVLGEHDRGYTHLGVGGGIVADSRPDTEWEETELKAARLLSLAGAVTRADTAFENALVHT